jgi:hypothetical protein
VPAAAKSALVAVPIAKTSAGLAGNAAPKSPSLDEAGAVVAPAAPAVPVVQPTASVPAGVLVPGWWLAIAAAIGSFATLAGVVFAR